VNNGYRTYLCSEAYDVTEELADAGVVVDQHVFVARLCRNIRRTFRALLENIEGTMREHWLPWPHGARELEVGARRI
jgi:hypothetical protein